MPRSPREEVEDNRMESRDQAPATPSRNNEHMTRQACAQQFQPGVLVEHPLRAVRPVAHGQIDLTVPVPRPRNHPGSKGKQGAAHEKGLWSAASVDQTLQERPGPLGGCGSGHSHARHLSAGRGCEFPGGQLVSRPCQPVRTPCPARGPQGVLGGDIPMLSPSSFQGAGGSSETSCISLQPRPRGPV